MALAFKQKPYRKPPFQGKEEKKGEPRPGVPADAHRREKGKAQALKRREHQGKAAFREHCKCC